MSGYRCEKCGMQVAPLKCGKCGAELVDREIEVKGKQVHVAECPKGCGMIKSPQCCGHDMACKS